MKGVNKGALANAEKLLEAIKSLAGQKGIIHVPFKTLAQAAGFQENQKTSARSALDALVKVGAIKIEWVFDPKAAGQGQRIRNPEMSDDRIWELVSQKVIKEPNEAPGPLTSDLGPVITVLKSSISSVISSR